MKNGRLLLRWGWTEGGGCYQQSQYPLTPEGLRAAADAIERSSELGEDPPDFFIQEC
jgi:hypothetical protein